MPVSKSTPSTASLLGEYLTFSPTPREVACFEADMRTMSRPLLSDAIKEALAKRNGVEGLPPEIQRIEVHRIYARKVKELAALYPVIFALENGLRGTLSTHLSQYFRRPDWWAVVRDAVRGSQTHTDFKNICGMPVAKDFIKQVFFTVETILGSQSKDKLMHPDSEDQIFALMTLCDLSRLMTTDWERCRGVFRPDCELGFTMDKNEFRKRIVLVRDARNEIFHSNPIRNRTRVFAAAEFLLDALDFHLGDFDEDLKASTYVRASAATKRAERHRIPARALPRIRPLG